MIQDLKQILHVFQSVSAPPIIFISSHLQMDLSAKM